MDLDFDFEVQDLDSSDAFDHLEFSMEEVDVRQGVIVDEGAEDMGSMLILNSVAGWLEKARSELLDKFGRSQLLAMLALIFACFAIQGMLSNDNRRYEWDDFSDQSVPVDTDLKSISVLVESAENALTCKRSPPLGILSTVAASLRCMDEMLSQHKGNVHGSTALYLSMKDLNDIEALLKKLETILSKCSRTMKAGSQKNCVDLADYLSEVHILKRISQLNVEMEDLKDAVQGSLNSHVQNSLNKAIFDLQGDFQCIESLKAGVVPNQLELELTTRRIVCSLEVLRVYDRFGANEELRSQALAYVQSAHALEDEILRRLHYSTSERVPVITHNPVQMINAKDSTDTAANTTNTRHSFPMTTQDAVVTKEAKESTHRVISYGDSVVPKAVTDAWKTIQYQKRQQRLEQRHKAECDAETRYRCDEQLERDERSRSAAITMQRSMLRNSDDAIFTQRTKDLTEAFNARLCSRQRVETFVFIAVGAVSSVAYIAVTFGCEGRSLGQLLSDQLMATCKCALDESVAATAAQDVPAKYFTLSYINNIFMDPQKHVNFYESSMKVVTKTMGVLAQSVLGLDMAHLGDMADWLKCLGKVARSSLIPVLVSKILTCVGLPQVASGVVVASFLYGLVMPLFSVEGFLRQLCIMLATEGLFYLGIYLFDAKLQWRVYGVNIRGIALYVMYPILSIACSVLMACSASSHGLSRGLKVGHKQSLLQCGTEIVKKCFM